MPQQPVPDQPLGVWSRARQHGSTADETTTYIRGILAAYQLERADVVVSRGDTNHSDQRNGNGGETSEHDQERMFLVCRGEDFVE